jgi:DNA-directed RNA polymerase specialized sigma subunit|tara:strand:+ start:2752 stop:3000 length:249 start_codon:yes stop_codon:yes gene_type:complete
MRSNGLKECSRKCIASKSACKQSECRHFIEYPEEFNCVLVTVFQNGNLTLRQTADRLGISFARVKQIEKKALQKLKKSDLAD